MSNNNKIIENNIEETHYYIDNITFINMVNINNKFITYADGKKNKFNKKLNNEKNNKVIKSNNENGENNPNKNVNLINNNINFRKYINEEFYPILANNRNINAINLNIVDVIGDDNCLYRCISRFVYETEDLHQRVLNEISNEALNRLNEYPHNTIDTEKGPMLLREYVNQDLMGVN